MMSFSQPPKFTGAGTWPAPSVFFTTVHLPFAATLTLICFGLASSRLGT